MGLDQYAYSVSAGTKLDENTDTISLMDWRKHNRLQGYMEELAIDKGILKEDETFNCKPLKLTKEDIDDLEEVILGKKLPETGGFFFGGDSYTSEYEEYIMPNDLKFIEKAREALDAGQDVYYDSWW